jgi:hypothetical protein
VILGKAWLSILIACNLGSQSGYANSDETSSYPEHWGELSTARLESTECPLINGFYNNDGYIYELIDNIENSDAANSNFKITPSILVPWNKEPSHRSSNNINSVVIKNQNEDSFTVIKPELRNSTNGMSYVFAQSKNEYKCKDGWVVFEEQKYDSSSESSSSNTSKHLSFTILKDGSLLVKNEKVIHSTRIFMLVFSKKKEIITYGKFKRNAEKSP